DLLRVPGTGRIVAEEYHANAIDVGQFAAEQFTGSLAQESIGFLHQQTATVAGSAVCGDTAAMRHAGQRTDRRLQQVMARLPVDLGNQAEAAVVPEFIRMIQTRPHNTSLNVLANQWVMAYPRGVHAG